VDGDSPAEKPQAEWQSSMLDVAGMTLGELAGPETGSVLAESLRRLATDLDHPAGPIAGFNSAL
jgi:FXSXX-COOH protein